MRRFSMLVLLGLVGLPAAGASACELIICPTGPQGQPADILYYVLLNKAAVFQERHEYIDTGTTAGITFDDGTGPHRRVVHEFRTPVVRAVCQGDQATFEQDFDVQVGARIQGELFQVLSTTSGSRVGTVFIDDGSVGVRASGGGLSLQETYACGQGAQALPVLQNLSLLHSALDTNGIDGATPQTIETHYLGPIRSRLATAAHKHMRKEGCNRISYGDFATRVQSGMDCELHYDQGDPTPGVFGAGQN